MTLMRASASDLMVSRGRKKKHRKVKVPVIFKKMEMPKDPFNGKGTRYDA